MTPPLAAHRFAWHGRRGGFSLLDFTQIFHRMQRSIHESIYLQFQKKKGKKKSPIPDSITDNWH